MTKLFALGGLLAAAALSMAGQPYTYRPSYTTPTTYAAPIYQKVYVAESVLVPIPVPSALLVNLSPAAPLPPVTIAAQALVDAQNSSAALLQRMQALEAKLDQLLGAPQQVRAEPIVPAKPTIQQVAGVLKANCMQCHSGPNSRGDVQLFNDRGDYAPNLPMTAILAAVRSGRMPKGPTPIPEGHKAILEAFAR